MSNFTREAYRTLRERKTGPRWLRSIAVDALAALEAEQKQNVIQIRELDIALHGSALGGPWMMLLGEVAGLRQESKRLRQALDGEVQDYLKGEELDDDVDSLRRKNALLILAIEHGRQEIERLRQTIAGEVEKILQDDDLDDDVHSLRRKNELLVWAIENSPPTPSP